MTPVGPLSAAQLAAQAAADPSRRQHWYRPAAQPRRLLVVIEDSDGVRTACDAIVFDEVRLPSSRRTS